MVFLKKPLPRYLIPALLLGLGCQGGDREEARAVVRDSAGVVVVLKCPPNGPSPPSPSSPSDR
jgi:hypothetical protein